MPDHFSVNGKQYVAISVGTGSAISTIWPALSRKCRTHPDAAVPCGCLNCPKIAGARAERSARGGQVSARPTSKTPEQSCV